MVPPSFFHTSQGPGTSSFLVLLPQIFGISDPGFPSRSSYFRILQLAFTASTESEVFQILWLGCPETSSSVSHLRRMGIPGKGKNSQGYFRFLGYWIWGLCCLQLYNNSQILRLGRPWCSRLHYTQILYLLAVLDTGTSCRPTNVGEVITVVCFTSGHTVPKSYLCIPRNETAWPRSQFLHSFLHCHRPFICSAYPNFLYIPFKLSDI